MIGGNLNVADETACRGWSSCPPITTWSPANGSNTSPRRYWPPGRPSQTARTPPV